MHRPIAQPISAFLLKVPMQVFALVMVPALVQTCASAMQLLLDQIVNIPFAMAFLLMKLPQYVTVEVSVQ